MTDNTPKIDCRTAFDGQQYYTITQYGKTSRLNICAFTGQAQVFKDNNRVFDGRLDHGAFDGQGIIQFGTDSAYVGNFKHNRLYGGGMFFYEGKMYAKQFNNNDFRKQTSAGLNNLDTMFNYLVKDTEQKNKQKIDIDLKAILDTAGAKNRDNDPDNYVLISDEEEENQIVTTKNLENMRNITNYMEQTKNEEVEPKRSKANGGVGSLEQVQNKEVEPKKRQIRARPIINANLKKKRSSSEPQNSGKQSQQLTEAIKEFEDNILKTHKPELL